MKVLLVIFALFCGKFYEPSWALERAKRHLKRTPGGKGHTDIREALYETHEVSTTACSLAIQYIDHKLGSNWGLPSYLKNMGLLPVELWSLRWEELNDNLDYFFFRDRFVDDIIRELKEQGM